MLFCWHFLTLPRPYTQPQLTSVSHSRATPRTKVKWSHGMIRSTVQLHFTLPARLGADRKFSSIMRYGSPLSYKYGCFHSCSVFTTVDQHCQIKTCFTTRKVLTSYTEHPCNLTNKAWELRRLRKCSILLPPSSPHWPPHLYRSLGPSTFQVTRLVRRTAWQMTSYHKFAEVLELTTLNICRNCSPSLSSAIPTRDRRRR